MVHVLPATMAARSAMKISHYITSNARKRSHGTLGYVCCRTAGVVSRAIGMTGVAS